MPCASTHWTRFAASNWMHVANEFAWEVRTRIARCFPRWARLPEATASGRASVQYSASRQNHPALRGRADDRLVQHDLGFAMLVLGRDAPPVHDVTPMPESAALSPRLQTARGDRSPCRHRSKDRDGTRAMAQDPFPGTRGSTADGHPFSGHHKVPWHRGNRSPHSQATGNSCRPMSRPRSPCPCPCLRTHGTRSGRSPGSGR